MKYQILFSAKHEKTINLSSVELAQRVVKIKDGTVSKQKCINGIFFCIMYTFLFGYKSIQTKMYRLCGKCETHR